MDRSDPPFLPPRITERLGGSPALLGPTESATVSFDDAL